MAMPPLAHSPAKRRTTATVYARPAPMLDINEHVPGTVEPWEAIAPVRPDTPHVRALRFLDLGGDLVSGVLIIAGGVFAYGIARGL
ncbi:hypothetical protein HPGCJGGD_1531 [Methylobacterium haplocladii]|nr:hypothetical protein [Methylobacterium haplocladii]GJD83661.1 hypothetical protein HPGCJGGD_1531 [Methylobacterium haplocladii]